MASADAETGSPSSSGDSMVTVIIVVAVLAPLLLAVFGLLLCQRRKRHVHEMYVAKGVMDGKLAHGTSMPPLPPSRPLTHTHLQQQQATFSVDPGGSGALGALEEELGAQKRHPPLRLEPLLAPGATPVSPQGDKHTEREARDEMRSLAAPWGKGRGDSTSSSMAYAGRSVTAIAQDMDYWNQLAATSRPGYGQTAAGSQSSNLTWLPGPWGPGSKSQGGMQGIDESSTWTDIAAHGRGHSGPSGRQPTKLVAGGLGSKNIHSVHNRHVPPGEDDMADDML